VSGTWIETAIDGHLCDLFEPAEPDPAGAVLIYLHGVHLKRLVDNPVYTAEFARRGLRVAAPFTNRSWWTDRICAEFSPHYSAERFLLDQVVPWVEARWDRGRTPLALFGTSMGGQGALRFAFKHPNRFPVVAALSPAIDYQQRFHDPDEETLPGMYPDAEAARQDTATLRLHPLNWPRHTFFACDPADHRWYDSSVKLRSKMVALGIPFECDLDTTAGGHGWTYYDHQAPRALDFITTRLEQERRRL
jgi:S-formylglutathione hydrolase FrmB